MHSPDSVGSAGYIRCYEMNTSIRVLLQFALYTCTVCIARLLNCLGLKYCYGHKVYTRVSKYYLYSTLR